MLAIDPRILRVWLLHPVTALAAAPYALVFPVNYLLALWEQKDGRQQRRGYQAERADDDVCCF